MKKFWTSQRERVSHWGLLPTLGYYLFGVAADRVGIRFLCAYRYERRPSTLQVATGSTFAVLESPVDWTSKDVEIIKANLGENWLRLYGDKFSRGSRCGVTRLGDELASLLWMQWTTSYCQYPGKRCVLLSDGVTFPDHRGKGLLPQSQSDLCEYALRSWGPDIKIFSDCPIVNYASMRLQLKAGFAPTGWIISVFNRAKFWPKRRSAAAS